jgi:RimJ/RimL family protein N-acetyltransferase
MDLLTERLRLRPWADGDFDSLHRLWSDPATIWWGASQTLEETRVVMAKILRQGGWWAVNHDDVIVGNVFLRESPRATGMLELGYHFLPASWGQGFATEAARAVLETAPPGARVEATVVPENARSQRVVMKLGFLISGPLMHSGRLHDLWVR